MKKVYGVRLETQQFETIVKEYGSFTHFVRHKIKTDNKLRGKNANARKRKDS